MWWPVESQDLHPIELGSAGLDGTEDEPIKLIQLMEVLQEALSYLLQITTKLQLCIRSASLKLLEDLLMKTKFEEHD